MTHLEKSLSSLRHLYSQMIGGLVKDGAQAKRIAEGILSPAIANLEKSALRAPAAPVPQGWKLVPVIPTYGMLDAMHGVCSETGKPMQSNIDQAEHKYASMLAAAPQPPEAACSVSNGETQAAPVQMPEPVGVAFTFETEEGGPIASQITSDATRLPMGWCKLYTEQQVRELLAAHGIKVAP